MVTSAIVTAPEWISDVAPWLAVVVAAVAALIAYRQYRLAKAQARASKQHANRAIAASKTADEHREAVAQKVDRISELMERRIELSQPHDTAAWPHQNISDTEWLFTVILYRIYNTGDVAIRMTFESIECYTLNGDSFCPYPKPYLRVNVEGSKEVVGKQEFTLPQGKAVTITIDTKPGQKLADRSKITFSCDPPLTQGLGMYVVVAEGNA